MHTSSSNLNTQGSYKRGVWKNTNKDIPKGVGVCPKCHAIFFKKSWHNPDKLPKGSNSKTFDFHVCRACNMISAREFEGELFIKNVPQKYEFDLTHMIAAFGRRAMFRDNQDRICEIEKTKDGFTVTTTENQLALKLAKKIKETFKDVEVVVSHSTMS